MAIPFFTKKLVIEQLEHLVCPDQYIRYFTFFHSAKYDGLKLEPEIHQVYLEYLFEPQYRIATLLQQMDDEIEYLSSHSDETRLNILFNSLEMDLNYISERYTKENVIRSIEIRNREIAENLEFLSDGKKEVNSISKIELTGIDEYVKKLQEIFKPFRDVVQNYLTLFNNGKIKGKQFLSINYSSNEAIIAPFIEQVRQNKQNCLKEKASYDMQRYSSFKLKSNTPGVKSSLTDLMNSLKTHHFISEETTIASFREIFSGDAPTTKIIWTGTLAELHYFVDNLFKLMVNSDTKKWQTCSACFIDKKGNSYIPRSVGQAKVEEINEHIKIKLQACCDHLLSSILV